jgi:hypothetical protein
MVEGSGYRVQGIGYRVQGIGVRFQGLGSRVQGLAFNGQGLTLDPKPSVRAGTLNRYLSATLKERLKTRGAPKLKIRSGQFLEVVIVDFSSAGRHQENFGRTSPTNAQAAQGANAHCNLGAPRALRRSLSVIHSDTDLACRPGLTVIL